MNSNAKGSDGVERDLNEKKVSLSGGRFTQWLRRNKVKLIALVPTAALMLAGLLVFCHSSSDKTDYIDSTQTRGSNVMRWQHFSEFGMKGFNISIVLDSHSDEIYLSDNRAGLKYNVSIYPENIRSKVECVWTTSNDVIAAVNNEGEVEASVPGEVNIGVSFEYEGRVYSDSAFLRVTQPVTDLYMPTTTINLYKGGGGKLIPASVSPANASDNKIIWTSKNTEIATVDTNGYVTPVNTGMTKVTAATEDGGFTGECFVNVINYAVMVTDVNIEAEYKDDARLREGETYKVSADVLPSNARDKTLKWTSTNPDIASVSQTGIIRALRAGQTYINAASVNGMHDMIRLTVEPGDRTDRLNLSPEEAEAAAAAEAAGSLPADGTVNFANYPRTLQEAVDIQMAGNPPPKRNGGNEYASRDDVERHMDASYYKDGAYKYQFMDLSCPNGVSADELNKYLEGKGVLEGHAQDFIDAAKRYELSELYLVAHSALETGNGSSALARGISVNGTTVYNLFGIGAYDNSAVYSGSQRAYREGWTSVSAAIFGGAEFISEMYVNAREGRQNTLYKMLFNPENPGEHEYATDCEWAVSQSVILDRLFMQFPNAVRTYEIPLYEGMEPFVLDTD